MKFEGLPILFNPFGECGRRHSWARAKLRMKSPSMNSLLTPGLRKNGSEERSLVDQEGVAGDQIAA